MHRCRISTPRQGWSDGAFSIRIDCSRVSFGRHAVLPSAGVCEARIWHHSRAAGTTFGTCGNQVNVKPPKQNIYIQ